MDQSICDNFQTLNCSTNASQFPDYWYWDYGNGTILYFSSEPDWQCSADFRADSDIGGPGAIIAFVVTAWITCLVALIVTYRNVGDLLHQDTRSYPNDKFLRYASIFLRPDTIETAHTQQPLVQFVCKRVLDSLCDLQIITGTAILIAGLSQYPDITFYHEQLVISYWSLTLNSFWAARAGDLNDTGRETWYIRVRTVAIICSVILAVVYQSLALRREAWPNTNQWDPFTVGFCYRTHDNSGNDQNVMWITGLSCYTIYLAVFLFSTRSDRINWLYRTGEKIKTKEVKKIKLYMAWVDKSLNMWQPTAARILEWISYMPIILWWTLLAWCDLWSVGSGSPTLVIVYWGFAAWNTYDIIDYKLSNQPLLQSPESSWGFGQVLAVVLMATIIISFLDAFTGNTISSIGTPVMLIETEARKKSREEKVRGQPRVIDAITIYTIAPSLSDEEKDGSAEGA